MPWLRRRERLLFRTHESPFGNPAWAVGRILQHEGELYRVTRWVEFRIDVTEGLRYRVASMDFEGNKIIRSEGLRPLFKVRDGDWYSDKAIRKGYDKARELYGSAGYYQFNFRPGSVEFAPRASAQFFIQRTTGQSS